MEMPDLLILELHDLVAHKETRGILVALAEASSLSSSELRQKLTHILGNKGIAMTTFNYWVNRLCNTGLVDKERDLIYTAGFNYSLTDYGQDVIKAVRQFEKQLKDKTLEHARKRAENTLKNLTT